MISQPTRTSIGITIALLGMAVRCAKPERQSAVPWNLPRGWIALTAARDQMTISRSLVGLDRRYG